MKQPLLYSLITFLLISLLIFSCDVTDSDVGLRISGVVVDENSGNPLSGALVEITMPQALQQSTTTDDDGRYVFDEIDLEEETQITIQVSRDGYNNGFAQVLAQPDRDVSVSNILLRQTSENGDDGGGDDGVPGPSSTPDNIVLTGVSNESINIRETGGIVNSSISVQVQDSSGRALGLNNAVDVEFTRLQGPDDIKISPELVRTNNNGLAVTNITSGL